MDAVTEIQWFDQANTEVCLGQDDTDTLSSFLRRWATHREEPLSRFLRSLASDRKLRLFAEALLVGCHGEIPFAHVDACEVDALEYVQAAVRRASLDSDGDPYYFRDIIKSLHEVFGNPFRPVEIDPNCATPTVTSLAQAAYAEHLLPSGHLDVARLTVLADALEDAGCTEQAILDHLHSPGPHVRGCWALDSVLVNG